MKNKLPMPVVVVIVVIVVALASVVIFRSAGNASASGDVTTQINSVLQANPQNGPPMPAGVDPTKGAIGFGSKRTSGTASTAPPAAKHSP
jgi:hypothetical protein